MAQQLNIQRLHISQCLNLPKKSLLTEAQQYRILVPICSSNVVGKIVSSWHKNSGPVTCLQDRHHGDTSCYGCRDCTPGRTQRHMYFINTENFPYPRRNGFSTDWPVLPIVTLKRLRKRTLICATHISEQPKG